MSSWGNLDHSTLTGTVTAESASSDVVGFGTYFLTEVKDGDYITIDSNKYQIEKVNSNTAIVLTGSCSTNSDNVTAYVQQGPKFVSNVAYPANNYSIQNVYGVDTLEINVPENKAKGISSHTGWSHYTTYTTSQGETRYKAEVLVALSKNFNANAAGYLQADAVDDIVIPDYFLYFSTQPENTEIDYGETQSVSFFAEANAEPSTGTIAGYAWYEDNGTHSYALTNTGVYSGATTNTLSISDVAGLDTGNNYSYFVVVSGSAGVDSNTSQSATISLV